MRIHILEDTTAEGLETKINKIVEKNQGAINSIQYQAVAIPQLRGKEIVDVKTKYSAMIWAWE